MRKRVAGFLLSGGVAALAIGLSTTAALATTATTFSVSPGGSITGTAAKTTLTDTKTGNALSCKSSKATGTVKSGTGLAGAGIGSISALTFSNCTGPLGLSFTVTTSAFPWSLNAVSYKKGVTTGTITGIHAVLSGSDCTATVDGTSATADNGEVKVTYTNSTGKLKVLTTGGNLTIYNVSGCLGLINSGDPTTFSGTYTITPKQTITGS
jgi:hypothetical protein